LGKRTKCTERELQMDKELLGGGRRGGGGREDNSEGIMKR
jgi:hypothetical protein